MNYHVRYYKSNGDDFTRLNTFMIKNSEVIADNTPWSYQRFVDWKYSHTDPINSVNHFWERTLVMFADEQDEIIGIGINEDGDNVLSILMDNEHSYLFEQFFEDAIQMLLEEQSSIVIELSEKQRDEIMCLTKKGYKKVGGSKKMTYDLNDFEAMEIQLENGCKIVSMEEAPRYPQQGRLRASAFLGKTELTDEDVAKKMDLISVMVTSPTYQASTDLVMIDSQENVIAGCEPLINFTTLDAEIERVCTDQNHRNQGLSRALINEALSRLKQQGIKRAYLSGWNDMTIHLYSSFGPHKTLEIYTYEFSR